MTTLESALLSTLPDHTISFLRYRIMVLLRENSQAGGVLSFWFCPRGSSKKAYGIQGSDQENIANAVIKRYVDLNGDHSIVG